MVAIVLALIAAIGSVGTAYVAVVAKQTQATVNGRTDELLARVDLLEDLLGFARQPHTYEELAELRAKS